MPAERAKEDGVKFLKTLFGIGADPRAALLPLYGAVVAEARRPVWHLNRVSFRNAPKPAFRPALGGLP